uniref:Atg9 n=1 Tax=Arundo donax TaxID=35708 RepID=A0A0A9DXN2_ARUDO
MAGVTWRHTMISKVQRLKKTVLSTCRVQCPIAVLAGKMAKCVVIGKVWRLNKTVLWISWPCRGLSPPMAACRILFPALALEGGTLKECTGC